MLGCGTFGQVVKCRVDDASGEVVAVKVIKNHPAYHHQARCEVAILQLLNGRADPEDAAHIVRLRDTFAHARHLCLVFEALQLNLYELLKQNNFRGLSTPLLRLFLGQLLTALSALRRAGIIHCDLKPENVLLVSLTSAELKLIDFGSACAEGRTVYSYIQSRFYRAPEVVLGAAYGAAIDMWSLGCMAAELFLGLPLFPGASEYNLMQRITEALGPPPEALMAQAKHGARFFKRSGGAAGAASGWALLSATEHEALTGKPPALGKRYFAATTLPELIHGAPFRRGLPEAEVARERTARAALLDWLQGVMCLDATARWTPAQAAAHPFITGAPWEGAWRPPPEPPRRPLPPPPLGVAIASQAAAALGSSPLPSPRSAPAWPGGALPVGVPHSPQTPRGLPIPGAPGGAPGPPLSGSAGAPGDYFPAAALGLSSPGQYQALLMQHAVAAQQRAAAAARFGLAPLSPAAAAAAATLPFGLSPPHSLGAMSMGALAQAHSFGMAQHHPPQQPFGSAGWPPGAFEHSMAAAAAAAGRAAAAAHGGGGVGGGLPPARRGSAGARELSAAAAAGAAAAGASAAASPRAGRGAPPRAVRRRASEGGASLGSATSLGGGGGSGGFGGLSSAASQSMMDCDASCASPSAPNPADWDPSYSDDALLHGSDAGIAGAAEASAQAQAQAQHVAALAQAHAQAHVLQMAHAHAHALQLQQAAAAGAYAAWPGLAAQQHAAQAQAQAQLFGGASPQGPGPGLAAWGAQHGFGAPPPPQQQQPVPLQRRESWAAGARGDGQTE
jgi:dual specificity protein kinase YAK1